MFLYRELFIINIERVPKMLRFQIQVSVLIQKTYCIQLQRVFFVCRNFKSVLIWKAFRNVWYLSSNVHNRLLELTR